MKFRAEVSGMQEILDDLQRMGEAGVRAGIKVLGDAAKEILEKSKPLVPVEPGPDGGDLLASGRVTKPNRTRAGRISAGVVYGGAPLTKAIARGRQAYAAYKGRVRPVKKDQVYAAIQHEDLTLKHTRGQAKFLERPGNAVATTIPDRLLAGMEAERRAR